MGRGLLAVWFYSESDRLRTGLANGTYSSITLPVWDDPGAAIRDHALAELQAASRIALDNAAHVCAGEVRAGCADAPEEPSWWESGLKFVEALWDIATLLPFSPANLVQDAWKLATGDLTPEELARTYELDLETVQGMWQALQEDPVEFGSPRTCAGCAADALTRTISPAGSLPSPGRGRRRSPAW